MKTLVAYYSLSGNNRRVGELVAKELDADLEEIRPKKQIDVEGPGVPFMGVKSMLGMNPGIFEGKNPSDYDLLVLGAPAMMGRMSPVMRSYLKVNRKRFPEKIAFFMSCGGFRENKIMDSMVKESKKKPLGTLILLDKEDMETGEYKKKIKKFCDQLATAWS